jgi:hypothetical protein
MHTLTPTTTPTAATTNPTAPTPTPAEASLDRLLRCVSSGYLSGGCPCQRTIPASFVSAAWARELEQRSSPCEDRFFRLSWRGGEWLSYGLSDGRVRGVYCPEHSAARTERSSERDGSSVRDGSIREARVACVAS